MRTLRKRYNYSMDKNIKNIRRQFPILKNRNLRYLDNSATTQKPETVLEAIEEYYKTSNANIHRGSYELGKRSTDLWIQAHEYIAQYINADSYKEIIFVRNATEGLNLLASTFSEKYLNDGDMVVLTEMEHHSNIVPWMMAQKKKNFNIKYIPVKDDFTLDLEWLENLVKKEGEKVKIVSVVHVSNVLGVRNDIKKIKNIVGKYGTKLIVDAAQSISHMKIDVKDLGCDALVFSGHKVYGPMGIGAIYCREDILDKLPLYMGGGDMIKSVNLETFEPNDIPWRYEAGTPNVEGGVVLMETLKWFDKTVKSIGGFEELEKYEKSLAERFIKSFNTLDWFKLFGPKEMDNRCGGVVAFNIEGFKFQGCKKSEEEIKDKKDGSELINFLSTNGICLRDGFHCAEPLHDRFKFGPTLRLSIAMYNAEEEIDFTARKIKEFILSNY